MYVSVVQTGKGNKRKNAARRSRKPYLNFRSMILLSSADVKYFDTGKLINSHRLGGKKRLFDLFYLFRILLWRALQAQMAAKYQVAI